MLSLISSKRRNKLIAKRLMSLLNLSIVNGVDQRNILYYIKHKLYINKGTGHKLTDADIFAWREDWTKALNNIYKVLEDRNKKLSKDEMILLNKSEVDFAKIMARNHEIEMLNDYIAELVEKERFESAAFVRDLIRDYEEPEKNKKRK